MTIYSIEKLGNDYVVKADNQMLMIVGSRRRAAQLVIDACGLLDEAGLLPRDDRVTTMEPIAFGAASAPGIAGGPSITRDSPEVA
ncbi:MAG: hypothetical protein ABWY18_02715 [Tardiphaga sp.]